ncbi:MAG: CRISPR-associated endonuclease Cas2 [Gammaproteobacteria bacterium]|nr:CRISPR-associated endonuclease Cas2 [Gammaproteobacteria bacterium]
MSRNSPLRVLCYDISSNKKRRRVARILENEASRVQFSVFETRITNRALEKLVSRVEALLDKGDTLRVYTIHATGEKHCAVYGSGVPIENDANFWLL